MARQQRKPTVDSTFFQPTEDTPAPAQPAPQGEASPAGIPATGLTRPVGVGLKESEIGAVDQIAEDLGVARNALLRFAVRYWLIGYMAGDPRAAPDVEEPKQPKKRIRLP